MSGGEGASTIETPYGACAASEPGDLAYLLLESLAYGFQETTQTALAYTGAIDAGTGALVLFGSAYTGKSSLAPRRRADWRRPGTARRCGRDGCGISQMREAPPRAR